MAGVPVSPQTSQLLTGATGGGSGGGIAALIGPGIQIGNALLQYRANQNNIRYQREANQKARENAIMQAITERKWAIKDWNRQNQYNHPLQQMQRLKEAGLNPNLVYGNGATTTAASIPSTNISTPDVRAPHMEAIQIDPTNPLLQYYDLQARGLEVDNLRKTSDILSANADNIRTRTAVDAQNLKNQELQYDIQNKSRDAIVQERTLKNTMLEEQIESQQFYRQLAQSKFSLESLRTEFDRQRLELSKAKTASELDMIASNILRNEFQNKVSEASESQIWFSVKNLMQSYDYQKIHMELAKLGLTPGTPEYIARYTKMVGDLLGTLVNIIPQGKLLKTQVKNINK